MKYTLMVILAFCCLGTAVRAQSPGGNTPFKVFDMQSGEQISLTQLAEYVSPSDVVFWGEEHNDSIGHVLEEKLLKLLSERLKNRLTLSLEMFETDCQPVLDDYLGGFITRDKFIKEARAWNNYSDYSPMVEYARESRIPVVAANAPRRYVNLVSRRGLKSLDSLSDASRAFLAKLSTPAPKGAYYRKFLGIMGGADNLHSPHMFASQSLWDATMARSIYEARKNRKKSLVMHVCGRFHSDEYLGTVARLHKKDKNLNITTISCFPAEDLEHPRLAQYADLADFVILTRKMPEEKK